MVWELKARSAAGTENKKGDWRPTGQRAPNKEALSVALELSLIAASRQGKPCYVKHTYFPENRVDCLHDEEGLGAS